MATVVVTGATGFLGRHMMAHLASSGLTIITVSRQALPGVFHVQDYSQCPAGDVLIHLAEEPDRSKVNQRGEEYVQDSARVLKALASGIYRRIIYASSGVVYGDKNESACGVDSPVFATDAYSKSKLLNEQIVLDSGGIVVRLSNLFGDGMSASNVMSDIIRQLPGIGALRIRDDKPVRDYLSVSDAATAFGRLVASNYRGIVNVGTGIGTSVRALAELSLSIVGQESREIIATEPSPRPSINVLDIAETTKRIGWSPTSMLRAQLTQLIHNMANLTHE